MIQGGNAQLEKLVSLQALDNEVKELKKCQKLIPGQIEKGQKELESKKSRLNKLKGEIDDLQKQRNQCEQDVKSEQDHMIKAQLKLPAVKTNKEYGALLAEIEAIKVKISEIEEKELEIMEILEQKEAEIPDAKSEFEGYEIEFGEYKTSKENESARLDKELEEANQRRQQIFDTIDPKHAKEYMNIFTRREELAVVELKGEICQGCYNQIRPQVAIEVKSSDKLIHVCQSCHRILYAEAEPTGDSESAVSK